MSDLYNQIVNNRGSFEKLLMRIPGFTGYLNNKARRDADRMIRDFVAMQLKERINRMNRIESKILDNDGLKYMSKTREVKDRWQYLHDRIKAAAPGYSGFFAVEQIGEVEMQMLYNFDEALIRFVDRFSAELDKLESAAASGEALEAAIESVGAAADEANEAFSLREDTISQIDKKILS